jgi:restriction system protein
MMPDRMWMVRAGRNARWADVFLSQSVVGLGWHGIGDSTRFSSKSAMLAEMMRAYPDMSEGTAASGVSQLWRFQRELSVGDGVVTYESGTRLYHIGQIASDARYEPSEIEELTLRRSVNWTGAVSRDLLSPDTKNRLGSTITLFKVPPSAADELKRMTGAEQQTPAPATPSEFDEEADPFESLGEEAALRIADRVGQLSWDDMQRLVAAVLRAMGYRTEIARAGPDRGRDIFASPDGFGFEQPRIAVEVKHRLGEKIDAPSIRSFLGGRHKDDRGLFVSTGGFTKEAYYEADRATIPLKLMTLDDLSRAIIDAYDRFDNEGRALLPLTRIYWPA